MAIIRGGDVNWRCLIKSVDFDNQVAIYFIQEAAGRKTSVRNTSGLYEEVDDDLNITPEPTFILSTHEARDLANELAKWAERRGRPVAPAHTDALKAELKLITSERDFLRGLVSDSIGRPKPFSVDDVTKAVKDYHRFHHGAPQPSPVLSSGPMSASGLFPGNLLKGNPTAQDDLQVGEILSDSGNK